ncbi:MAG: hypothetical protein IT356_03245 [Gemmatimonadaceae bacterium]|nr:hypothetical protein [Gemmatimonadaceae bacterium]
MSDAQVGIFITCSMESTAYLDDGDSGAPVFSAKTSAYDVDVNFAGIMWATKDAVHRSYFSPISRIGNDFTSSLAVVRPINLTTPTVSGTISGSVPGISWDAISGASYYQVWRNWYRYTDGSGSNGWEYLGHNSSTFWDSEMSVDLYTGTTIPNFSTPGYVIYKVVAFGGTDRSGESTLKYFRLTSP